MIHQESGMRPAHVDGQANSGRTPTTRYLMERAPGGCGGIPMNASHDEFPRDEDVEAAARAVAAADSGTHRNPGPKRKDERWENRPQWMQQMFKRQARAALQAVAEARGTDPTTEEE